MTSMNLGLPISTIFLYFFINLKEHTLFFLYLKLKKGGNALKNKKFWQFKAKGNNSGDLMLYGDISSLNVYINSGGGDVFAGQAIYSMLKRHSATL